MKLSARFPRISAWLLTLVLLGLVTLCALQGLRALEPGAPEGMEHVKGVITAMRGSDTFAARIPGHAGVVWFHIAHDAHISLAHLRRHMHEQAPTDIYYEAQRQGALLAWLAD